MHSSHQADPLTFIYRCLFVLLQRISFSITHRPHTDTEDRVLGICSSTVVPALNDGNDISTQNVPVPPSVTNVSQAAQWVYRIPLMTVQTLFHSENPETSGWRWVGVDKPDPDQSLVKTIHWTNGDPKESPKMIVFVQEPWVLGHKDFTHFTRVKSVRLGNWCLRLFINGLGLDASNSTTINGKGKIVGEGAASSFRVISTINLQSRRSMTNAGAIIVVGLS